VVRTDRGTEQPCSEELPYSMPVPFRHGYTAICEISARRQLFKTAAAARLGRYILLLSNRTFDRPILQGAGRQPSANHVPSDEPSTSTSVVHHSPQLRTRRGGGRDPSSNRR
jgi:hypothetical protein